MPSHVREEEIQKQIDFVVGKDTDHEVMLDLNTWSRLRVGLRRAYDAGHGEGLAEGWAERMGDGQ